MAVKMQKEYGDALNTLFVEVQGHTMEDVQKLALKRKWFGSDAMWTTERPFNSGSRGIPNFVLLSPEGEVVMKGHPMAMHKQVEQYLAKFKKSKSKAKAPADLPKPLHAAYKKFAQGKLGAAAADVQRVTKTAQDEGLKTAGDELAAKIQAAGEAALARVDRAIEEGCYSYARDRCKRLAKLLAGSELAAGVQERVAKLNGEELAAEVKAEKALAKIEAKLYSKGASPAAKKQLARLSKKHQGTKAAVRADALANLIE